VFLQGGVQSFIYTPIFCLLSVIFTSSVVRKTCQSFWWSLDLPRIFEIRHQAERAIAIPIFHSWK
jgi:hypothetical protein